MLDVLSKPLYDNSITRYQIHTHQPYIVSALGPSDEIRIPVQQQELYTNISDSFLYIEGKITKGFSAENVTAPTELVTNPFAFLFEEIRYELNGQVIDKCRNLGIASTMKGYATYSLAEAKSYWNYGATFLNDDGSFSASIPLRSLLGFPDHYNKILLKSRHELVLLRAKNDDAFFLSQTATVAPKVELTKISWHVPYVDVSNAEQLQLLKIIDTKKNITVPFRSWDLHESPMIANTTKHSWMVKTALQMEKPRFVIIGFQTDRRNFTKDSSKFDHCDLTNIKLYLNSEHYPYDNLNVDFKQNQFEIVYNMYRNFQKSYLNREPSPLFDRKNFKDVSPLTIIDCSRQIESVKSSSVDVRIEVETKTPFPENTTAFVLIIHDRVIEYNPFTNIVTTLV